MCIRDRLNTTRLKIPKATAEIGEHELKYTSQLFEVYSEEIGTTVKNKKSLEKSNETLYNHFNRQRDGFYSAESLERFSRDNFPDLEILPFDDLKEEAYYIISDTLMLHANKSSFEKLANCLVEIQRISFTNSPLIHEIRISDKCGLCHHLTNEDKISWTK